MSDLNRERFLPHIKNDIESERSVVFIAENYKQDIVDFVAGGFSKETRNDFDGQLYATYVLPKWQNRGIVKRLFNALLDWMKKQEIQSMFLWVLKDNERAKNFYENMGGEVMDEGQIEIGKLLDKVCYGYKV